MDVCGSRNYLLSCETPTRVKVLYRQPKFFGRERVKSYHSVSDSSNSTRRARCATGAGVISPRLYLIRPPSWQSLFPQFLHSGSTAAGFKSQSVYCYASESSSKLGRSNLGSSRLDCMSSCREVTYVRTQ